MDELARVAWWETQAIGFGVIPEAPVDPNPPIQPGGYRQLTVGTLDGRVTAVLALHDEWAHSYVAGPYGTDVLVANDTGMASDVFLVSALDGSRTDLFRSVGIVAAAALGDGGTSIYYLELDRASLITTGLWRRSLAGGNPEAVREGSITEDSPEPVVYWITADPLEGRVVIQWCFGQVRCSTYAIDPATGAFITHEDIGWPLGADRMTFFGDGLGSSAGLRAWNTRTGEIEIVRGAGHSVPVRVGGSWRFVRDEETVPEGRTVMIDADGNEEPIAGSDPTLSTIGTLGERRGVVLPPGWVLRWPAVRIYTVEGLPMPQGHGQLIDVENDRRVDLPTPELAITDGAECAVAVPMEMMEGEPVGSGVLELLDGRRTARWGSGGDQVLLGVGWDALGDVSDGEPIDVRGHSGHAILIGDEGVGQTAFSWEEDGCTHTVWLPAGTTLGATVDYAERY